MPNERQILDGFDHGEWRDDYLPWRRFGFVTFYHNLFFIPAMKIVGIRCRITRVMLHFALGIEELSLQRHNLVKVLKFFLFSLTVKTLIDYKSAGDFFGGRNKA